MSKKHEQLEKTFNLPSLKELDDDDLGELEVDDTKFEYEEDDDSDNEPSYEELCNKVNTLSKELQRYDGMTEIPAEITQRYNKHVDEIHQLAKDGYEEVFSAALTLDPAHGSKFLAGAAKLLEIALRSKNSTMDKQLEMAKLQLQREKMIKEGQISTPTDITNTEGMPEGERGENGGVLYSRNEILRKMREQSDANNTPPEGDDVP